MRRSSSILWSGGPFAWTLIFGSLEMRETLLFLGFQVCFSSQLTFQKIAGSGVFLAFHQSQGMIAFTSSAAFSEPTHFDLRLLSSCIFSRVISSSRRWPNLGKMWLLGILCRGQIGRL